MSDYSDLLETMKTYRRQAVEQLDAELSREAAAHLATTHMAVLAIEAVMNEPPVEKTGPRVEYGADGWPKVS